MTKTNIHRTALSALAITLTACGGGGDDTSLSTANEARANVLAASTAPAGAVRPVPRPDALVQAAQPALSEQPLNTIVSKRVLPSLDRFFDILVAQKLDTTIDGVRVFARNSGDEYLPGKVAMGMSYLLLNTPRTDPKFAQYLAGFREISDFTIDITNKTWGIYYYTSALVKLKNAGLLEEAVNPATLQKLKTKLDYHSFVAPDYTLYNPPYNYYGVAFSIARLRYLLGWEGPEGSEALLQRMIAHYKTFSAFGFSDETDGSGRFDRYSVLLIGEIVQRLIETGMQPAPTDMALLRGWLRQSVDLIKANLNPAGNGFVYGRSLGPYADTAFTEVLSAAAYLDVLTPEEKEIAYAFATRVAAKYVEFWYDDQTKSLNMWDKGRRVDGYRGKARILGENMSLSHQLLYTANLWTQDGYGRRPPMPTNDFVAALRALPAGTLTRFAGFDGQPATYDRALVTYRDGLRVFSLPLVNGGTTYHRTNPYFAVPHSYNLLSGVADTRWPQLQAHFTMADGQVLIPASFTKNVQVQTQDRNLTVDYEMDALDRAGGNDPRKDTRISLQTRYQFQPGRITRSDVFVPNGSQQVQGVELQFGSYSRTVKQVGNRFEFAQGDVTAFEVSGVGTCSADDVSANVDYNTPSGPLLTRIRCTLPAFAMNTPVDVNWTLEYRSPSIASFKPQ